MTRYTDDTTIDDVESGDQLSMRCECGNEVQLAWRLLPKAQQLTRLSDLRQKMVCRKCGARRPTLIIVGFSGMSSQLREKWRWPPAPRT
ncbi:MULTISPECIES: hypothetical protein [unclassified Brevundimonas]|uniref:hypothetical protein n=1 Tax=unclassified Brevundimonas TaxID=2622653 RepID=UPI0025BADD1F|nr:MULTISPECIES: hypothetical protein [unclassified Brevundimonas]